MVTGGNSGGGQERQASRGNKERASYAKRDGRTGNSSYGEYKPRQYKPRDGGSSFRSDNANRSKEGGRPFDSTGNRDGKPRDNRTGGRDFKPHKTTGNRDYKPRSGGYHKDSDSEYSRPVRQSAAVKEKPKESVSEKTEIYNRLEREKKVVKKKNDSTRKAKTASPRPAVRVKRVNNIDWTKEYENDSYDDDDTYYDY